MSMRHMQRMPEYQLLQRLSNHRAMPQIGIRSSGSRSVVVEGVYPRRRGLSEGIRDVAIVLVGLVVLTGEARASSDMIVS